MSKTIDNRVVEMEFDNRQFEKNVSTTMSTLDKLKQKLNLSGASKGLEDLGTASKKCDLSPIGKAADAVGVKFSAMQVIGITALANITNSAVNAGKQLLKSLTITPITTGFQEYELKMGSIQTIMASTGESLETVNQYLDELNTYSDKTIYSFQDMTSNIGKFTNAGVKLEDAVLAIKGISNEAAVSGANANEASRAMYNFAQALSAGYVKLIDWKSIENANMATVEFKNQLIETALSLGTVTKSADGMYKTLSGNAFNATKNFNEVFQDQWMTSEVLIETLKKYADETTEIGKKAYASAQDVKTFSMMMDTLKESIQSGWAQTWEIIIGDFEEAKNLWTNVSNALGKVVETISGARNRLLEGVLGSPWQKMEKHLSDAGVSLDKFKKLLVETAEQHGKSFDGMTSDEEKFNKLLENGWLNKNLFLNTLDKYTKGMSGVSGSTEDMTEKLKYFQKVVKEVWHGDYKNGAERIEALTKAGYNYAEVQALVNKTVDDHTVSLEDLTDIQLENIGYTEEEIKKIRELGDQAKKTGTPINELMDSLSKPSGRQLLLETFANVLKEIKKPLVEVKEAWNNVFGDIDVSQVLYGFIESLHRLSEEFTIAEEDAKSFGKICEGIFSIFQLGNSIISMSVVGGLKILAAVLNLFGTNLLKVGEAIAEYIIRFKDWIDEHTIFINMYDKIAKVIVAFIDGIKSCVEAFMELDAVRSVLTRISEFFTKIFGNLSKGLDSVGIDAFCENIRNAFETIRKWIEGLNDSENIGRDFVLGIANGIKNGMGIIIDAVMSIASKMIEVICNILGIHSPSTEGEWIGSNFMAGIVLGLKNGATTVWETIKSFASKFVDFIKGIDFGAILAVGLSAGMLLTIWKMINVVEALTKPLDKLGEMFEGVGAAGKSIAGYFDSLKRANTAKTILSIGVALGILAASIYLLSKVNTKDLIKSVVAIGVLAGILAALALAMGKMGSAGDVGKFSTFMIAVSASLLLTAIALKKLGSIDPKQVSTILQTFTLMIVGLGVLVLAAGSIKGSNAAFARLGIMLIALSAALLIMTVVMKQISKLDESAITKGLGVVVALELLFAGIIALSHFAGKYGLRAGIMILTMSTALIIMIGVIKLASKLSIGEVAKGIAVIAMIEVLFAQIIAVSMFAGKYAWRAGAMLLAMSLALFIMTSVIKQIAKIKMGDITKGLAVVAAMEVLFAGIIAVSKLAGKYSVRAGIMLLLMSGALVVLTGVIYILSKIDPKGLNRAVAVITTLGVVFAMLIGVTHFAKDCKTNLIIMLVTVTMLAGIVAAFTFIDSKKLAGATAAMTILIGVFTALVYASSLLKNPGAILKSLIPLVVVVALIGGLVIALTQMKNLDGALETCKAISLLLVAMSASLMLLNDVSKKAFVGVGALAVMGLVVAELGFILGLFSHFNINPSLETIKSLSLLLIAMSASLVLLGVVGKLGKAAFIGIGALATLIAGIGVLAGVIGGLNSKFPELEKFLDAGIPIIEKIGEAIGLFFGNIRRGFIEGVGFGLPSIGDNLSAFIESIQPFLEGVKNIDSSVIDGVKSLSEAFLYLISAELLNGLTSLFLGENSMTSFGDQIVSFGKSLKSFSNEVAGIDNEAITASATAAKTLADMASAIPNSGGIFSWFTGNNDIAYFGTQLPIFGRALKKYSEEVTGIDSTSITESATAAKALADMASAIPNSGGIFSWFTGDNDIAYFGTQLPIFGRALKKYSEEVAGIDTESISVSVSAATSLSKLSNALPNYGGMITWLMGDNDISDFGTKIVMFGRALMNYSKVVTGLAVEPINTSISAATSLSKLSNALPKDGGILSWAKDDKMDFSKFSSQLQSLGKGIKSYSEEVAGINSGAINSSIYQIQRLISLIKSMSGLDTSGISTFKKALSGLSKISSNDLTGLTDSLSRSASSLSSAGANMADSIAKGFKSKSNQFKPLGISIVANLLNSIKQKSSSFKSVGIELMNKFALGIKAQSTKVKSSMTTVVGSSINGIRSYRTSFYNAGSYLVSGFTLGISSNSYRASLAAKAMASAAAKAAEEALDEHSPSKVGYRIGDYFGIAFVNAIRDNINSAYNASSDMASSAKDGLNEALSDLAYVFSGDLDNINPVISPILDLSNIESGTAAIGDMLNTTPSLGVLSELRAINARTNNQNGTINDVISSINRMNKNLQELDRNSYNINGINYEESSDVAEAIKTLVRAAKMERRT